MGRKISFETIDSALSSSLGSSAKEAIFWHFEKRTGISRNDIPNHMKEFHQFLDDLFGEGSKVIKRIIEPVGS